MIRNTLFCSFLYLSTLCAQSSVQISQNTLIRDVSWRPLTIYDSNATYRLLPSDADKITLLEMKQTGKNPLFAALSNIIPAEWNPNVTKTNVCFFDAFDALVIGIETVQVDIIEAALKMIPITRSLIKEGNTTCTRGTTLTVDGQCDITSHIETLYESVNANLNKLTTLKLLCIPSALCSFYGLTSHKLNSPLDKLFEKFGITKTIHYMNTGVALFTYGATEYLQRNYVRDFLNVLKVLSASEKITFNKEHAKLRLQLLHKKIAYMGNDSNQKLKNLISSL